MLSKFVFQYQSERQFYGQKCKIRSFIFFFEALLNVSQHDVGRGNISFIPVAST